MKATLILATFLLIGLFEATKAAVITRSKLQDALNQVESNLDTLEVPREIRRVADGLQRRQSSDPEAKDLSFTMYVRKLREDAEAVRDSLSELIPVQQRDSMEEKCAEYIDELISIMSDTDLGEGLKQQIGTSYSGYIKGHDKLDKMVAYGDVCAAAFGF